MSNRRTDEARDIKGMSDAELSRVTKRAKMLLCSMRSPYPDAYEKRQVGLQQDYIRALEAELIRRAMYKPTKVRKLQFDEG